MKKLFTLICIFYSLSIFAQGESDCTVNLPEGLPSDTMFVPPIPDATVGVYYEESINFRFPTTTDAVAVLDSTVVPGITIDAITIESISNLPAGLSWKSNQETYILPDEKDGCLEICGTPLMPTTQDIQINLTAQVSILNQSSSLTLPMTVLPATSTTEGFALVNNTGCGQVEVNIQNNIPSNGQTEFTYNWDFGNGLISEMETPPAQVYDEAGVHYISYEATIDTIGHILTQVTIETVSCDDIPVPLISDGSPDLFIRIFNESGSQIFDSPSQQDLALPITIDLNMLLSNQNYRLEVWDQDGGIDGTDDLCGVVNFTLDSQGLLVDDEASVNINIINPITTVTSIDSVIVYPIPNKPDVRFPEFENPCQGDILSLSVDNYEDNIQWFYNDELVSTASNFEATEAGIYYAIYTNEFGCTNQSESIVFEPNPLPPSPAYTNENNVLTLFDLNGLPEFNSLQWYFEGEALEGETTPSLCAVETGQYILELTDGSTGCTNTFSSNIIINPNFDCTVSVEEINQINIDVFPNPFMTELNIQSPEKILDYKIWTVNGQLLHFRNIETYNLTIPTSTWDAGFYILEINTDKGKIFEKVVKN